MAIEALRELLQLPLSLLTLRIIHHLNSSQDKSKKYLQVPPLRSHVRSCNQVIIAQSFISLPHLLLISILALDSIFSQLLIEAQNKAPKVDTHQTALLKALFMNNHKDWEEELS